MATRGPPESKACKGQRVIYLRSSWASGKGTVRSCMPKPDFACLTASGRESAFGLSAEVRRAPLTAIQSSASFSPSRLPGKLLSSDLEADTDLAMQRWSPSGLQTVPHLQWGSHLAHFFASGKELGEMLVPYFKAGLENNERCLWVTGRAFNAEQARSALRGAVSDLDKRVRNKQIEIVNGEEWYSTSDKLQPDELLRGLLQREHDAVESGHAGLRTSGNCAWVSWDQWPDFLTYEALVQDAVRGRRMICMCSYCVHDGSHSEIMERHDLSVANAPMQQGPQRWDRQKRTFDHRHDGLEDGDVALHLGR